MFDRWLSSACRLLVDCPVEANFCGSSRYLNASKIEISPTAG
jgi:hypothetical protein